MYNESIALSTRAIDIDPMKTTADGGLWSILSVFESKTMHILDETHFVFKPIIMLFFSQ